MSTKNTQVSKQKTVYKHNKKLKDKKQKVKNEGC